MIILLFIIIIIILIYYIIKNNYFESFVNYKKRITTWTPYVMDCYNQPCYSNYFYGNGYMYPVY
jgi:hypothetical protein